MTAHSLWSYVELPFVTLECLFTLFIYWGDVDWRCEMLDALRDAWLAALQLRLR
jgi:hypothetical protein